MMYQIFDIVILDPESGKTFIDERISAKTEGGAVLKASRKADIPEDADLDALQIVVRPFRP